jgi:hypothetical protein
MHAFFLLRPYHNLIICTSLIAFKCYANQKKSCINSESLGEPEIRHHFLCIHESVLFVLAPCSWFFRGKQIIARLSIWLLYSMFITFLDTFYLHVYRFFKYYSLKLAIKLDICVSVSSGIDPDHLHWLTTLASPTHILPFPIIMFSLSVDIEKKGLRKISSQFFRSDFSSS